MAARKRTRKPDPYAAVVGRAPGEDVVDKSDGFAMITPAHVLAMRKRRGMLGAYSLLWARYGKLQDEHGSFATSYADLAKVLGLSERTTKLAMGALEQDGWVVKVGTSMYHGRRCSRWRLSRSVQQAARMAKMRGVVCDTPGVSSVTPQEHVDDPGFSRPEAGQVSSVTPRLENVVVENASSQKKQGTGRIPSLRSGTGPGGAHAQDDNRMMAGGPAAAPVNESRDHDGRCDGYQIDLVALTRGINLDAAAGLTFEELPHNLTGSAIVPKNTSQVVARQPVVAADGGELPRGGCGARRRGFIEHRALFRYTGQPLRRYIRDPRRTEG
jgi:hypothetical protein